MRNDYCPVCGKGLSGLSADMNGRVHTNRAVNPDGSLKLDKQGKNWCRQCMNQYEAINWTEVDRRAGL